MMVIYLYIFYAIIDFKDILDNFDLLLNDLDVNKYAYVIYDLLFSRFVSDLIESIVELTTTSIKIIMKIPDLKFDLVLSLMDKLTKLLNFICNDSSTFTVFLSNFNNL